MALKKGLRITLCVDQRTRVAAFLQLLITVEKRAAPARDKKGRLARPKSSRRLSGSSDSASYDGLRAKRSKDKKQKNKLTPSQIRLAKKAGLISFYSVAEIQNYWIAYTSK